jgi:hypothetical protein
MNIAELTPETLRRAADIKEQIDGLQTELSSILNGNGSPAIRQPKPTKLHWTQTPQGRAKFNAIRARRWAKAVRKLHWTQTPEGRAKMARSMKRRWKRGEF